MFTKLLLYDYSTIANTKYNQAHKKIERRQKKKLKLHPYCGDMHVVILCILFKLKN